MVLQKKNAAKKAGDIVDKLFNKHISDRLGLDLSLMMQWKQIIGEEFSATTEPVRIIWPQKAQSHNNYEPGCLIVRCTRLSALRLAHQSDALVKKINYFFGYSAINRIKIEQAASMTEETTPLSQQPRALSPQQQQSLEDLLKDIKDPQLRASLESLGQSIYGQKRW